MQTAPGCSGSIVQGVARSEGMDISMRCSLILLTALVACTALSPTRRAAAQGIPLTVEKIYGHGPLIGRVPKDLVWSPDGKHVTYMDGG